MLDKRSEIERKIPGRVFMLLEVGCVSDGCRMLGIAYGGPTDDSIVIQADQSH